jgi:peptide/nickel transport system permease protein
VRIVRFRRPQTVEEYLVVVGAAIVLGISLMALIGPYIVPYNPTQSGTSISSILLPPSWSHLMGTDTLGRDVYSRILTGAPVILQVLFLSALMSILIGVPAGLFSGYIGGFLDKGLSLAMDSIYAFPGLVLAIAIAIVLGQTAFNIAVAVAVIYIPTYYRVTRSHTLSTREEGFVEAGRALGASNSSLLRWYILPSILPSLAAIISLNVADAMLTEAGLSFLGLGLPPTVPDWGFDISQGATFILAGKWWLVTFPGLMIILVVLGFSLLGEGLNDILNPRLRGRQV